MDNAICSNCANCHRFLGKNNIKFFCMETDELKDPGDTCNVFIVKEKERQENE